MKSLAIILVMSTLAGCSSLASMPAAPEQRAARNLCEVMRSYRPYYPDECGEHTGILPLPYRAP